MTEITTHEDTGYRTEWWHRRPFYTLEHIKEVEERFARHPLSDAEIAKETDAQLTIVRVCPDCGETFEVRRGYKTGACYSCRAKAQHRARKAAAS
jgi:hypothetical protein